MRAIVPSFEHRGNRHLRGDGADPRPRGQSSALPAPVPGGL